MWTRLLLNVGVLATASHAASLTVLSTAYDGAFTYLLGDDTQPYYVAPVAKSAPVATFTTSNITAGPIPFTVLTLNVTNVTSSTIEETLAAYREDDVYQEGFLEGTFPNHIIGCYRLGGG